MKKKAFSFVHFVPFCGHTVFSFFSVSSVSSVVKYLESANRPFQAIFVEAKDPASPFRKAFSRE